MKKILIMIILSLSLFSKDLGKILYNSCQYCHGVDGKSVYMNIVPAIVNIESDALVNMLREYKKGELDIYGYGKIMQQQMKNIPDDKISILTQYIVNLQKD